MVQCVIVRWMRNRFCLATHSLAISCPFPCSIYHQTFRDRSILHQIFSYQFHNCLSHCVGSVYGHSCHNLKEHINQDQSSPKPWKKLTSTLETLLDESIKHRTTVVTKSRHLIAMNREPMWYVDTESSSYNLVSKFKVTTTSNTIDGQGLTSSSFFLHPGHLYTTNWWHFLWTTRVQTEIMMVGISMVDSIEKSNTLTLISLLAEAPNELVTVGTECWLPKNGSHKFVAIDLMNTTSHCTSSSIVETRHSFRKFLVWLDFGLVGKFHHNVQLSTWLQIHLNKFGVNNRTSKTTKSLNYPEIGFHSSRVIVLFIVDVLEW